MVPRETNRQKCQSFLSTAITSTGVDKNIMAILAELWVKRERHDWIEGWDKPVTEFQVLDVIILEETAEDSHTSLSLFTIISVRVYFQIIFPPFLEDIISLFRVNVNNTLLFNAKRSASFSWKKNDLKPCSLLESPKFQDVIPRAGHWAWEFSPVL